MRLTIVTAGAWVLASAGCYRTHQRAGAGDAGVVVDARVRDAAVDAPTRRCDALRVVAVHSFGLLTASGQTPRLGVLPDGGVVLVYVESAGDPGRVQFARFSPDLEELFPIVTAVGDSWTWGEPAVLEGRPLVAFGRTGERSGFLREVSRDGRFVSEARVEGAMHPMSLEAMPARAGMLLWTAFLTSGRGNAIELDVVDASGRAARPRQAIDTGRYGSPSVARHRDGFVLGYTRDVDGRGIRRPFARTIAADGALGDEVALDPDADMYVVPAEVGGELALVQGASDSTWVSWVDPATFRPTRVARHPQPFSRMAAVAVGGRLLVAGSSAEQPAFFDFGTPGAAPLPLELPAEDAVRGEVSDAVSLGDAAVIAIQGRGPDGTYPVLVRVECR